MASISSLMDEIELLKATISKNNTENNLRNKQYRERIKVIDEQIQKYLRNENIKGFVYKNTVVRLEEKKPSLKSEKDRKQSIINILREVGVNDDPERVYDKLENAQRKPDQGSVHLTRKKKKKNEE